MKDLSYYLGLPYTRTLRRDSEGDFVARIVELPGCLADGDTEATALEALAEAQSLWLADALHCGQEIPEPAAEDEALPSGKWLQRVPRSLHRKLIALARYEGVSLNQFVTSILAEASGARTPKPAAVSPVDLDFWNRAWHGKREIRPNWILNVEPSWKYGRGIGEAFSYLEGLAGQIPDQWEAPIQLISSEELVHVHSGEPRVPRLSKGRPAIRGATRELQRKG